MDRPSARHEAEIEGSVCDGFHREELAGGLIVGPDPDGGDGAAGVGHHALEMGVDGEHRKIGWHGLRPGDGYGLAVRHHVTAQARTFAGNVDVPRSGRDPQHVVAGGIGGGVTVIEVVGVIGTYLDSGQRGRGGVGYRAMDQGGHLGQAVVRPGRGAAGGVDRDGFAINAQIAELAE